MAKEKGSKVEIGIIKVVIGRRAKALERGSITMVTTNIQKHGETNITMKIMLTLDGAMTTRTMASWGIPKVAACMTGGL